MSKIALIGKKLGMTNLFINNKSVPVTLIEVLPNNVVEVRNYGNKYGLILAGNEEIKDKKINKPQRSDVAKKDIICRRVVKEFSFNDSINFAPNTKMEIGDYLLNTLIDVRAKTIGKGFQGAMKRWGFGGLPASHGVSVTHRSLGSTGNRTLPGRVFKGKKMAGHMGNVNVCVQNLKVCAVDKENNIIAVHGSIPGKKNNVVYITSSIKKNISSDKQLLSKVVSNAKKTIKNYSPQKTINRFYNLLTE